MKYFAFLAFALPVFSASTPVESPTIDLGDAGTYVGILQNNGTVESWKGIPYATPPVGDLRFRAPIPLESRQGVVMDVSDDALRCVQFGAPSNIVGVKSGPGQEDCLKLWVWKPINAKEGDNLPVMFYIHGGGLQFSAAPNNDFSDWVGQAQNFIAVNVGYRLGGFGFMASEDLEAEGQPANAGLLDQRMGMEWVQKHISKFGGDPTKITIMGQSGGGFAVVSQLALYDGQGELPFSQAIARSIQRSPQFSIEQHKARNNKLAEILNCNSSVSQLQCFRDASVEDFVNATRALGSFKDANGLPFGDFLPSIDGVTLSDTVTKLWKNGKFAKVPFIGGYVSHESAGSMARNATLIADSIGGYNLSDASIQKILSIYPVNASWGEPYGNGAFQSDNFRAAVLANAGLGEGGATCSERLVSASMCARGNCDQTWAFRFAAPTVGTDYGDATYPLAYVVHSADNSYLQNATAVMTDFEKSVAAEWRSYIGSFIRTGNPNKEKLDMARYWPTYHSLNKESPVHLVPAFMFSSSAEDALTGTSVQIAGRPQVERCDWWLSDEIVDQLHV
ncbi:hypothetical protein Moror_1085 [Moniliophthora roreri MCA 2997]|uniref:Carboxylic ester hydrolase n=1 Tax=Moniliophthora roreri (strain MCA 2997) TaxID=1381753 RepID=V2YNA2_MONRO|nr:hypothetical protein Moror_1085 [Moniliophthora roreri MCA 2997]